MSGAFALAKVAAQIATSLGVSKIVGDIVYNNVNIVTVPQAILVRSGSLVLGSMLVQQSLKHVDESFDGALAWYVKQKEKTEEAVPEEETK